MAADDDDGDEGVEVHRLLEDKRLDDVSFEEVDDGKGGDHLKHGDAALELDIGEKKGGKGGEEHPDKGKDRGEAGEDAIEEGVVHIEEEECHGGEDGDDERDDELPPDESADAGVYLAPHTEKRG